MKVKDLMPRKRADVTVKVISLGEKRQVIGKDGSSHQVVDVLVGDETGCVLMSVWDSNINKVTQGKVFAIEDGFVSVHRGSMRLSLGRTGKMVETQGTFEVNTQNNISNKVVEDERRRY
ncbi:single-stranded DNA-binding protein [Metallosphaera tengchongensis]|uniref:Single-stranded DNA-binding protein n=1 Tax=Metallosphaera tengchongensis TaxID=1532350 RepID=A0A6N0NW86_9CREN|nr:single-stranded DNA-binding protein [Metallosphaera tengchongensis]QKR00133.1 single-stranded DNA-binding protein [Metallosphaera tengchongensis]